MITRQLALWIILLLLSISGMAQYPDNLKLERELGVKTSLVNTSFLVFGRYRSKETFIHTEKWTAVKFIFIDAEITDFYFVREGGRLDSLISVSGLHDNDSCLLDSVISHKYKVYYNEYGKRQRTETYFDGSISEKMDYIYNKKGQLDSIVRYINTVNVWRGTRVTPDTLHFDSWFLHEYNDKGQLVKKTEFTQYNKERSKEEYFYDKLGRLKKVISDLGYLRSGCTGPSSKLVYHRKYKYYSNGLLKKDKEIRFRQKEFGALRRKGVESITRYKYTYYHP